MDIQKGVIISRTNLVDSKKEAGIPWKGTALIIILTLAILAGAYIYNDISKKKINVLQNNLNVLKQGRDYDKIAFVSDTESRLSSLNKILVNRVEWEKLLQKIEENTLPDITFMNMETKAVDKINPNDSYYPAGTAEAGNSEYQVDLRGTTIGLNNLAKQIMVFEGTKGDKTEPLASVVKIQKIEMKKSESGESQNGGALDFTIRIDINPNIIKTDFNSKNQ